MVSAQRTIVVIDDEQVVRESTANLIRSLGLAVQTFASADAFLASERVPLACIVSDVQMPGTSGLELQRLVAQWRDPPPMIIMTGYPERLSKIAADAGAICVLEKPITPPELISCLEAVLGDLA
jgi:FixJ family two-component response regulator